MWSLNCEFQWAKRLSVHRSIQLVDVQHLNAPGVTPLEQAGHITPMRPAHHSGD
jgi:hypothetical protein